VSSTLLLIVNARMSAAAISNNLAFIDRVFVIFSSSFG